MKSRETSFNVIKDDTLINAISGKLPDLSNKRIKQYLKFKMVKLNGKFVTNGSILVKVNDHIVFYFEKEEKVKCKLHIIYEDEDIIVINKPSGLLSISNEKEKENTAFHLVYDYVKSKDENNKLFVVHRLDEDTSGVLLFAKNLEMKELLQDNWNDLVKKREYTLVVNGKLKKEKDTIQSYIAYNHFQMGYSTKNKEVGKLAITEYEVIDYHNNYSLVKVNIKTGRRNQIRVHFSEMGYPLVGDKKYGCKDNSIKRLALHANKLVLINPKTKKEMTFISDVPKEILDLLK